MEESVTVHDTTPVAEIWLTSAGRGWRENSCFVVDNHGTSLSLLDIPVQRDSEKLTSEINTIHLGVAAVSR